MTKNPSQPHRAHMRTAPTNRPYSQVFHVSGA